MMLALRGAGAARGDSGPADTEVDAPASPDMPAPDTEASEDAATDEQ
jgi:hypothetical protein